MVSVLMFSCTSEWPQWRAENPSLTSIFQGTPVAACSSLTGHHELYSSLNQESYIEVSRRGLAHSTQVFTSTNF